MALDFLRTFKLATLFGCLTAICAPAQAQRGWNLPEDDWIFQALLNLRNSGLVTQRFCSVFSGLPSRQEVARYAVYVHDEFFARTDEMERDRRAILRRPITFNELYRAMQPLREKAELFSSHRDDIATLRRIIEKLRPELTEMGRNVDEILVGISVTQTRALAIERWFGFAYEQRELPFNDVPEGHWVYDALEEGRNRQFFFGYPDELFRGGKFATRYEMAGMINAMFQDLRGQINELQNLVQPGDPMDVPPSLAEMAQSLARYNWVLKHRRELIQFAFRF